ncbi:hypothetical protein, partial [Pseudomonas sp. O11]|uniref:hypothetical protein n=1 Tax=Pseudomonas sp. O11 TaxID=3159446 RepID=UPI00387B388A
SHSHDKCSAPQRLICCRCARAAPAQLKIYGLTDLLALSICALYKVEIFNLADMETAKWHF